MKKLNLLQLSLAASVMGGGMPSPMELLSRAEKKPKVKTNHDKERIYEAAGKRAIRAAKRAANIAKSIANNPCLKH